MDISLDKNILHTIVLKDDNDLWELHENYEKIKGTIVRNNMEKMKCQRI